MSQTSTAGQPAARPDGTPAARTLHRPSPTGSVARSALWSVTGYGGSQVVRIAANMLLARWLFPEAFGVVALANGILLGLEMLGDVGIQAGVIRHARGDEPSFLDTAWTLQVMRGIALSLAAVLLAPLAARAYGEPALLQLIPLAGLATLLGGFDAVAIHSLPRNMHVGRLTALELVCQLASTGLMLLCVWQFRAVWCLLIGRVLYRGMRMALSWFVLPGRRARLRFDREELAEFRRFGRWIMVSSSVSFLALQTDRLLLGALTPLETLGVYSIAAGLVLLPREVFLRIGNMTLFPYLSSKARQGREELVAATRRARFLLLPAAMVLCLGMVAGGPWAIERLYDARYADAGWMIPLLVLPTWLGIVQAIGERTLLALGNSGAMAKANVWKFVVATAGCMLGHLYFGIAGFIGGLAVGGAVGVFVIQAELAREGVQVAREDLAYTVLFASLGALVLALPWMVRSASGPAADDLSLVSALAVAVGGGVWLLRRFRNEELRA